MILLFKIIEGKYLFEVWKLLISSMVFSFREYTKTSLKFSDKTLLKAKPQAPAPIVKIFIFFFLKLNL